MLHVLIFSQLQMSLPHCLSLVAIMVPGLKPVNTIISVNTFQSSYGLLKQLNTQITTECACHRRQTSWSLEVLKQTYDV